MIASWVITSNLKMKTENGREKEEEQINKEVCLFSMKYGKFLYLEASINSSKAMS